LLVNECQVTLAFIELYCNKGISLIENFGPMGVPYPPAMKKALEAMRDKAEKG
jgi:phage-related holin